ncbi:MAG: flavin reductase family protein [Rhodocyclales bacterium]|jgi:flavin reductase (DIM6/NTAB) family NADH-FMN oxidoreductase RutF|nr:flavin reductase family protein [Rhodocyclales bacterium]
MNQPYQNSSDRRTFRNALGEFATGVTVVTAHGADGRAVGVTINSFASVSLEPALVLWSLGRESSTLAAFESCSHYAINVLAADQVDFSQRFSQSNRDDLANIDISIGTGGAPILPGCCAWFECRNEMRYPGGDHLIFVGLVEGFHRQDKLPLVFHRGRYRELA